MFDDSIQPLNPDSCFRYQAVALAQVMIREALVLCSFLQFGRLQHLKFMPMFVGHPTAKA